jgi:hypothetical protein
MSYRHGNCEAGIPHEWSDFQPGYGPIVRSDQVIPQRVIDLLRERLSCDTEPWRACTRCGALITWNEWHGVSAADLPAKAET